MGFSFLDFLYESAVLELKLSVFYDVHGLVAFGDSGEDVFLIVAGWDIFGFGVLDLLDAVVESLYFELVGLPVEWALLDLLKPHWKIKNDTEMK